MSIPGFGNTLSQINLSSPVNRDHPLNRRRIGWWLTVPELAGGNILHDLIGGMPGTLTNMGAGSGWAATTRKGGAGKLIFDGTNDHVIATPSPAMNFGASTQFTIAAWVAFNGGAACVMFSKRNSANNYPFAMLRTTTTNTLRLYTNNGADHFIDTGILTLTNGVWYRIVMWNDGTNGRIYLNGVPTIAATAQAAGAATTGSVYIGGQNTGAGLSSLFTGSMDDVSAWDRVLTDAEIRDDFDESSRGYPTALNRQPFRRHTNPSIPASASGAGKAATTTKAAGTATGTANASGAGKAATTTKAAGAATGTATASGAGKAATTTKAAGTATGTATASGAGQAATTVKATGSATGTATASGAGKSASTSYAAGSATGTANASGPGRSASTSYATGTASGNVASSGSGRAATTSRATGSAIGNATASGAGRSSTTSYATGSAIGSANASGPGRSATTTAGAGIITLDVSFPRVRVRTGARLVRAVGTAKLTTVTGAAKASRLNPRQGMR